MLTDVQLRCDCGKVRGVAADVAPSTGNRMVCYCDDCQAFAHFIERRDLLDAWGGSDIFQMAPGRLRISDGVDQMRCMRLGPKGMFRWYAGCCRTPIANTIAALPFAGLHPAFIDRDVDRDVVLGRPRAYAMARFAIGTPSHADGKTPVGVILRVLWLMVGWIARGKAKPSPFFDANKRPIAEPKVLSEDERARLPRGLQRAS
jgi:hypothetical protein